MHYSVNLGNDRQGRYSCATSLTEVQQRAEVTSHVEVQGLNLRPKCLWSPLYLQMPVGGQPGFQSTASWGYWWTRSNFWRGLNINLRGFLHWAGHVPPFVSITINWNAWEKIRRKRPLSRVRVVGARALGSSCNSHRTQAPRGSEAPWEASWGSSREWRWERVAGVGVKRNAVGRRERWRQWIVTMGKWAIFSFKIIFLRCYSHAIKFTFWNCKFSVI